MVILDGDRAATACLRQTGRAEGTGEGCTVGTIIGIGAAVAASSADPGAGCATDTGHAHAADGDHPDAVRSFAGGLDITVVLDPHIAGSAAQTSAARSTVTAEPVAARAADTIGSILCRPSEIDCYAAIAIPSRTGHRRSGNGTRLTTTARGDAYRLGESSFRSTIGAIPAIAANTTGRCPTRAARSIAAARDRIDRMRLCAGGFDSGGVLDADVTTGPAATSTTGATVTARPIAATAARAACSTSTGASAKQDCSSPAIAAIAADRYAPASTGTTSSRGHRSQIAGRAASAAARTIASSTAIAGRSGTAITAAPLTAR
jgi:hypothetical protein